MTVYPCVQHGGIVWCYRARSNINRQHLILNGPDYRSPTSQCRVRPRIVLGCRASRVGLIKAILLFCIGSVEGDITRRPTIYEVIPTDYGFVAGSGREREDDLPFLSANVIIMRFQKGIASVLVGVHLWVPMDDKTPCNMSSTTVMTARLRKRISPERSRGMVSIPRIILARTGRSATRIMTIW